MSEKTTNTFCIFSFGYIGNILHEAFEDGPDRGFRNVGKTNLTPGKYPKENIQDSEHDENLKSRTNTSIIHSVY
jgi:hypothetical protein